MIVYEESKVYEGKQILYCKLIGPADVGSYSSETVLTSVQQLSYVIVYYILHLFSWLSYQSSYNTLKDIRFLSMRSICPIHYSLLNK